MVKLLAVISPAKTLDFETDSPVTESTEYRFPEDAQSLVDLLKTQSVKDIQKLMKLSENLAELNVQRYHDWQPVMTEGNSKQALFAFKGDVYTGLSAETLELPQISHAQEKLRILSGLYGLLRPLDRMQPYRLEMGTRLKNERGANLYDFWGDKITRALSADLKASQSEYLVNLASGEYYKAVKEAQLPVPVITPNFLDEKNGEYKIISFFAKKARGLMVRYILDQNPKTLDSLKAFNYAGYKYSEQDSDEFNWVFKRPEQ
jgi:cytoplasmic iron level regulating protein YaaA (DUF328/UPF0246 family)